MRDVTVSGLDTRVDTAISTHTSHAGRDELDRILRNTVQISTHTSHAGRDLLGRTWRGKLDISTHTSHAGRDLTDLENLHIDVHFYSHVPCGT